MCVHYTAYSLAFGLFHFSQYLFILDFEHAYNSAQNNFCALQLIGQAKKTSIIIFFDQKNIHGWWLMAVRPSSTSGVAMKILRPVLLRVQKFCGKTKENQNQLSWCLIVFVFRVVLCSRHVFVSECGPCFRCLVCFQDMFTNKLCD